MPWSRIDDQLHAHPKFRQAWRCRQALGLWLLALSYAASYRTDGDIPDTFPEDQLPDSKERTAAITALVRAGLWDEVEGGWRIHDYLDWNPSEEMVKARRKADRERKADERQRQRELEGG